MSRQAGRYVGKRKKGKEGKDRRVRQWEGQGKVGRERGGRREDGGT